MVSVHQGRVIVLLEGRYCPVRSSRNRRMKGSACGRNWRKKIATVGRETAIMETVVRANSRIGRTEHPEGRQQTIETLGQGSSSCKGSREGGKRT